MATIHYSEKRTVTCKACGATNVVKIAPAPGPAEEWHDIDCAGCGAPLAPREKQGLIIVELQE